MGKDFKHSYPELSEEGKAKTQSIVDKFSTQLKETFNNTLYEFTCNLGETIVDDDSWVDVRQKTLEALCGYNDAERSEKAYGTYLGQWWVKVRQKILEENREAIINDIILDMEAEIKGLNERIKHLQNDRLHF